MEKKSKQDVLKISKDGPAYSHLLLLTEDQFNSICDNLNGSLDIGVNTLLKLFEYEDILTKFQIPNYPESLEEYLNIAEKGIQCLGKIEEAKNGRV